ncbi:zinc finger MYND domain-containing protein 11-like isoform X2 [Gigantopelta aegis]|uniref:zinc finger MYND domain-containing protein 11-like isoform X2 n=1 Tax=Gigantopelta aegis TaxID=1735272 RepID=UPI001B88E679|nr:zinc finger MYND domain-containing protein 11-like isoform X2 [Gigantopelta aegis]
MVRPVKRRLTPVITAIQLLDAVIYIRQQKQIPNMERLIRYMQRWHDISETDTEKHINNAVADGFLRSYTAVGTKGSKIGSEQEGFRIPDDGENEEAEATHDWYCFHCHKPGEMYECSDCWRAFHADCQDEDTTGVQFVCSICKAGRKKNKLSKKLLNRLLSYTILRLKEKTRELHKIGSKEEEEMFTRFIFRKMDLNTMEEKVANMKYKCLEEFLGDTQTVLHNVFLTYGDDKSGMSELARIMIRDCKYDLEEIRYCPNCYHMSNAKPANWFCQPCTPPHELVYAKQKGFSYWPAKVINKIGDDYDVRFFGGWHQRAVIPKEHVKPITMNIKTLVTKRTSGFVKACKELAVHQGLVSDKKSDLYDTEESDHELVVELEDDSPQVTSTSVLPGKKSPATKASSPEDSLVVTSSEDHLTNDPIVTKVARMIQTLSVASQTNKLKCHTSSTQTIKREDSESLAVPATATSCNCKKPEKQLSDLRSSLEKAHKEDREKALANLSQKLKKDFEEDKQQAVARAMDNKQREIEKARRQADEKYKEQYMEEMKKLAQKHKEAISLTKKKQWCYNCEEEAMYHCCWNTSYCSVKCQQEHWHKEHKRVCRRKR